MALAYHENGLQNEPEHDSTHGTARQIWVSEGLGLLEPSLLILSRKPNIFDNMIAMMEKYANNLEALVDERTDQLQQEKRKTGKKLTRIF